MSKIVIDAMGGDNAPKSVVEGAVLAKKSEKIESELILIGNPDKLKPFKGELEKHGIAFQEAEDEFGMDEKPSKVLRRKDSSLYKGAEIVKNGEADAFISAGNTGGLLAVSTFVIGRIKGVPRPAIATPIPSIRGFTTFLDSGANLDCKLENYLSFARMGIALKRTEGVENPKVGILNVGAEKDKGTEIIKQAHSLLTEKLADQFIGFVEGREITLGDVDVVVTDGWSGNIALKSMEGVAKLIMKMLKESIMSGGILSKLGAGLLKSTFDELKRKMDSRNTGGGYIIGVNSPALKAHGNSDDVAIYNAIRVAEEGIRYKIVERIRNAVN